MKSEVKSPFLIAMTLALVDMLALSLVSALAAGRPKRGGILTFVVASEPPMYDGQSETTFGTIHPVTPF